MPDEPLEFDSLVALFKPLLTVEQAGFLLDGASEDHVVALLDQGALRGVNIALEKEGRRTLRIYRYTVEHFVMARAKPLVQVPIAHILTHMRATLIVREAARVLNCTEQHVRNLNFDGPRYGSAGSQERMPRIFREALINWIEKREIK